MDMISPDHADIYRRIEKVEVDVAVLDSKSNRLHEDLVDMRADIKMMNATMQQNSITAQGVESKVNALPKVMAFIVGLATLALGIMSYIEGVIR